jgi:mutual gliding-motility protein MglA
MASVNPHTRELVFKLVFYGPGLGGKTTTLQYIHAATKAEHRGKMVSLATPTDRTLYFDFLPIRVPRVRGMAVRLQLFTVPGQVYYAATRKLVLSGADGVVFVADSQSGRMEVNQESLDDLHANLAEHNRALEDVPHTFHWNKRDLSDLVAIEELDRRFNVFGGPSLGTVATRGDGVFEGLERITRLVLKAYEKDPKVKIGPTSSTDNRGKDGEVHEDGIAQALRQMEGSSASSGPGSAHGNVGNAGNAGNAADPPTKVSQVVPDLAAFRPKVGTGRGSEPQLAMPGRGSDPQIAVTARGSDPQIIAHARGSDPQISSHPKGSDTQVSRGSESRGSGGYTKFTFPEPSGPPVEAPAPPSAEAGSRPLFTFSDLWPEGERDRVRQAEQMLAARDAVNAILACDVLVTRVLASAAGLVGTLDAPRDPALVTLLLGLDGARYLQFRTVVRAARHRESVSMRDALECFAFSVEARRAREMLRR